MERRHPVLRMGSVKRRTRGQHNPAGARTPGHRTDSEHLTSPHAEVELLEGKQGRKARANCSPTERMRWTTLKFRGGRRKAMD